jgi:hypothetical protein
MSSQKQSGGNDEVIIPQQHLLPKSEGKSYKIGSVHNELDEKKMSYIINMRKDLCKKDICFNDGSLNLKYFNVKKGHYWSKKENDNLILGVIEFGATDFKKIRADYLKEWTETEIRLRICKLLRYYDLEHYRAHKFKHEDEIFKEAKKNREEAQKLDDEQIERQKAGCQKKYDAEKVTKPKDPKLVGGIYFNPPPLSVVNKEHEGSGTVNQFNNFFTKTKSVAKSEVLDKEKEDNMDENL